MKKAKKILALLIVVTLTIGPASLAFAEDSEDVTVISGKGGTVAPSGVGTPSDTDAAIKGGSTVNKTQEPEEDADKLDKTVTGAQYVAPSKEGSEADNLDTIILGGKTINKSGELPIVEESEKVYADLVVELAYLYDNTGREIGTYPRIKDAPSVNSKIERDLLKIKQGEFRPDNYDGYLVVEGNSSIVEFPAGNVISANFRSSYPSPVNRGRYAKVAVKINATDSLGKLNPETVVLEYYVDKENMSLMKKDAFENVIVQLDIAETDLLSLRDVCEQLGLTISYDSSKKEYTVSNDTVSVAIRENLDIVYKKKVVSLDEKPRMIGDKLFVPVSFFTELFGYELGEEEEEIETIDEVVLIPLRAVAVELGYTVNWVEDINGVEVSKDDVVAVAYIDENVYLVDEVEYELEIAPVLVDGIMQVPSTFFTELLGEILSIDAEGNITVG